MRWRLFPFLILGSLATPWAGAQTGRPVFLPGKAKTPKRALRHGADHQASVEPLPLPELTDTSEDQNSENGWYLSPHGTIRILVLFAEVVYDKNPGKDPQAEGAEHWPKGQLPRWKDNIFDPQQLKVPKATVTRYYHDISLGQYIVLGDYIDHLFTLRESEYPTAANGGSANALVIKEANTLPAFRTAHGLTPADFDLWKDGAAVGMPKSPGADDPHWLRSCDGDPFGTAASRMVRAAPTRAAAASSSVTKAIRRAASEDERPALRDPEARIQSPAFGQQQLPQRREATPPSSIATRSVCKVDGA
ncbi:MAG: hypothetical protein IPO12_13915 [Flavobacteriales bacterium]|nr:hypothetical protein [Flavobacteriales bacterium]